jgi:hypothetical protein
VPVESKAVGPGFVPPLRGPLYPMRNVCWLSGFPSHLHPKIWMSPHCIHMIKVEVSILQVDCTFKWSCYWTSKTRRRNLTTLGSSSKVLRTALSFSI